MKIPSIAVRKLEKFIIFFSVLVYLCIWFFLVPFVLAPIFISGDFVFEWPINIFCFAFPLCFYAISTIVGLGPESYVSSRTMFSILKNFVLILLFPLVYIKLSNTILKDDLKFLFILSFPLLLISLKYLFLIMLFTYRKYMRSVSL